MHTAFEQEATLRIPLANVPMPQPLPPAHLVIQPQAQVLSQPVTQPMYLPSAQSVASPPAHVTPYASAPAAHAPHMIRSATPELDPENSNSSLSNCYWKEPVGYPAARPIGRGKELLDHQLRYLDFGNVPKWISVAAQIRDRNMSRRMAPLQYEPAWRPQGRLTMSGDMPLPLLDMVN